MRVLIIEDNEKFRSILQGCLEPDGWDLALATTPAQALSHFRSRPADVVLAEMELKVGSSLDAVKEIRTLAGGAQVPVVLMSAFFRPGDEPVRRAISELGVKEFVRKPFSVFDLRDQLARLGGMDGGPLPKSPPPRNAQADDTPRAPSTSEPLEQENLRTIARLWSDRASGVLEVQGSPSHNDGFATLSQGGTLDNAGARIVQAALHGGTIQFTAGDAVGEGDHAELGARLYEALTHHANRRFLDDKAQWVLAKTSRYSASRSLPLTANTRLFMGLVHEDRPLGEILEDLGLQASTVAAELECLCRLKLVEFLRRAGDDEDDWSDEPTDVRKRLAKLRAKGRKRKDMPEDAAVAPPPKPRKDTPLKVLERIEREVGSVRGGGPPVVLGLPKSAGRDMAQKAHGRLKERYETYLKNPDLDPNGKTLAQEMLRLIDEALHAFDKRLELWMDKALLQKNKELVAVIQEGRDLVFQERWVDAEKVLERAQGMALDDATTMGLLAWVRLHHPDLDPVDREADALDMMLLSEQFDMNNATAQYYLAKYYFERRQFQEAAPRIVRAQRALPKNPHIGALMKQIKEGWNAPAVEIDEVTEDR